MIRDILKKSIHNALENLSVVGADILLEHPTELSHGDYSTNIAMMLAKELKQSPRDLAENIVKYIKENQPREVLHVDVAGSGFINFHLSRQFFAESLTEILQKSDTWGTNSLCKGKKVMVEYTDPNPFKEFHIGHLMSNAIGESISRIVAFSGAEVKRANYQGDVGLHVAKAIWGLRKSGNTPDDIQTLGTAYARGAFAYEEEENAKAEMQAMNKSVYTRDSEEINALYDKGRTLSLAYFETIYQKLGTRFDHYFFESESGVFGKETVREHTDVFEESEGAVVFRGEAHGLHTRVFINKEGLPTYEAKELGLAKLKHDTYSYDLSLIITGNEVSEYFKVILKAMEYVFPELAPKTRNITHGMMRLATGKMSSRTGEIVTAESLIQSVQAQTLEKMKDADEEKAVENKEEVAERVAVGAIKYSILKQSAGKDIVFDMEKALSFEGDSGPYLEYAYARACAVLAKTGKVSAAAKLPRTNVIVTHTERLLYRFPEVVERAALLYEPHHITTYLTELAGVFNNYYAHEKILDGSPDEPYKLALTKAFAITMKNGLALLAIPAPEKM